MSPIVGYLKKTKWVVFDETHFEKGSDVRQRHLFQIPLGQTDYDRARYKQTINTSMLMSGMLDIQCTMLVTRLNVLFLNSERPLRLYETDAYRHMCIQFSINRKTYWETPAWQCASPFALFDTPEKEIPLLKENYGVAWDKIGANFADLGTPEDPVFPDHQAKRGLVIFSQECFEVRATWFGPPFKESLDMHVYLDGELSSPIQ
jgi:hypothetical protein